MADDRIEQAERTPAKNQSCTGRPVESRLATVGEKWDNVDRTVLRGSLTERNLARICAQKRAFLLPARSQLQKDTLTVMATEDWPVKCRLFVKEFLLNAISGVVNELLKLWFFRCAAKRALTGFWLVLE